MAGIVRQLFIRCASLALLLLCPLVCSSPSAIDQRCCNCTSTAIDQRCCNCTSTLLSGDSSDLSGSCICPEYGIFPDDILQNILHLELNYSQPVILSSGNIKKFYQIKFLNISGMQFVEPGGFQGLETLERLVLYDNYMRVLENNMFTYLESLTRLIVKGTTENKIYALENGTFCNLTKLKLLNLKRNAITEIVEEHFRDLENLDILDFTNNRLTQIKADTFINAPLLTEIYLSKNLITEVHQHAFNGLKSLVTLALEGNRIKGMPQPVFSPGSLRGSNVPHVTISLDDNPLRCDCHLNWISSWLDVDDQHCDGRCLTPSKFSNQSLELVYKVGLRQCQSNNTILPVEPGKQLELTCSFAGASWVTPDGRSFEEHGDCEDPFYLTNSDSLVIWKTTPELSGNYTCLSSDGTHQAFFYQVDVNEASPSPNVVMIVGIAVTIGVFLMAVTIIVMGCKLRKNLPPGNLPPGNPPPVNPPPGNPPPEIPPPGNPPAEHDAGVDDHAYLLRADMDQASSAKQAGAAKYQTIIFQKDSSSKTKNINIL